MAQGPMAMAETHFPPLGDEQNDDLPRTFRREKEARAREARERTAQERAAAPSLPTPSSTTPSAIGYGASAPATRVEADPSYAPQLDEAPYPATVQRFDVPFMHLVTFFLKAVVAAVPALILLTAILWTFGSALEALFPELIKMKILISFPNG